MQEHHGNPAGIRKLRTEEADLWERDSKLVPDNAAILYRLGLLRYTLDEYDKARARGIECPKCHGKDVVPQIASFEVKTSRKAFL